MKEQSIVNNVNIFRPLIYYEKNLIYKFSHKYNIPYFKDTTPDWSNRGILRRKIFPLLEKTYTNKYLNNLSKIANESIEWNELILDKIIIPFMKNDVNINKDFKKQHKDSKDFKNLSKIDISLLNKNYLVKINNLEKYKNMPVCFLVICFNEYIS